jgi:hypothetical protein
VFASANPKAAIRLALPVECVMAASRGRRMIKHPDRHDRALGQTLARFNEAPVTLAIGSGTTYAAMGWGLNQTQL